MASRTNRDAHIPSENDVPMIQVTVLYENVESGLRAKALMEHAESGLDFPAEFRLEYWRFDWLNEALLGHMAWNTAKESALVIIAATSASALPQQIEDWIQAWAEARSNHPSALIVLLPGDENGRDSRESLRERLHGVAQGRQVDVFCECFGAADAASGEESDSKPPSDPETRQRAKRRHPNRPCPGIARFAQKRPPFESRP